MNNYEWNKDDLIKAFKYTKNTRITKLFIEHFKEKEYDIKSVNSLGMMKIHLAIMFGDLGTVKLLLKDLSAEDKKN